MEEGKRRCRSGPWDEGTRGVYQGHFHIPAGMVVVGGRRQSNANQRYICHREAFFPRQRDFDTPDRGSLAFNFAPRNSTQAAERHENRTMDMDWEFTSVKRITLREGLY